MASNPIKISVIIVNYGTPGLAIKAVESVLSRQHGGHSVTVHLLDNASPGNDAENFRAIHSERNWGARVTVYTEKTNHGFGRGNNIVLRALASQPAPPDMVMLLNPDAQLDNETIRLLASFLSTRPDYAIAGPAIVKPDGTNVTSAFRFPNAMSEFVQSFNFGPLRKLMQRKIVPLPPDHPDQQVDWVAGAAPLIRFKVLQDAEFFDPAYFLYYEEVDMMRLVTQQGWKIGYLKEARVIHVEGAATGVRSGKKIPDRVPRYWYTSWSYYYIKHHGRTGACIAAMALCLGSGLNVVMSRLRGRPARTPQNFFQDFWGIAGRKILNLEVK